MFITALLACLLLGGCASVTPQQKYEQARQYLNSDDPALYPRAAGILEEAACEGNAMAAYQLGYMHSLPHIYGLSTPDGDEAVVYWYERALELDPGLLQGEEADIIACDLVTHYHNTSPAKLFAFYRRWAGLGDYTAQHQVGRMYDQGQGTAKDERAAAAWFRQYAAGWLPEHQYGLAVEYQYGYGLDVDMGQAIHWYERARAGGYTPAYAALSALYLVQAGTSILTMKKAFNWAWRALIWTTAAPCALWASATSSGLG